MILFGLLKRKKLIPTLLNKNSILNALRLGSFLGTFNASYKLFLCVFRRIFKDDKKSSWLAGLVCGLFLSIENPDRRWTISLIAVSRALYTAFTKISNDTCDKDSDASSLLAKICSFQYGEFLTIIPMTTYIIYVAAYHLELMSHSSQKMVFASIRQKRNDVIFR